MESDHFKFIISEVNKLLSKSYTLHSFDLLSSEQLLQVLSDILSQVDGSDPIDLRQELLEDTVIRILEMLRILNYKIQNDISPPNFRQGLVQGEKKIIHPILYWILTHMDELKKRSYLAPFLVKLEIPPEMLADPDIAYLFEQYEKHIEEFKVVHKESEALKDTALSVAELRTDIKTMESEKDSVIKKIEKLKRRIETFPDKERLLEATKTLRLEKEKTKELMNYEEQQQSLAVSNEQKLRRLSTHLRDLRQNTGVTSPQDLMNRLEEECSVNAYLADQKLPQEIRAKDEVIKIYQMVLDQSNLSRAHLDDLSFKIQQISSEVTQMMESQLAEKNPGDDKNAPFRQQTAIIARKKEAKAEQLSELRIQLTLVEEELTAKQKQLKEIAGDAVLRGDDLKKYVSKLRGKGALFKKQKAQLAALKTEAGVLTRTLEILAAKDQSVLKALSDGEKLHGVEGYHNTRAIMETVSDAKIDVDTSKEKTLIEMSKLVVELTQKVAAKKVKLEPLIAELRPLRDEFHETKEKYEQLKRVHDSTGAGLENSIARLQQEVDQLKKELESAENEIEKLLKEIAKAEEDQVKVTEEVKLYVSGNADAKKNSLREQLQQKINEQEKIAKHLKEEQAGLKDMQATSAQQVYYWKQLEQLLKCKIECLEDDKKNAGVVRREKGAETLILPQ